MLRFSIYFQNSPNVVLKLKKPEDGRKVKWEEGTVDNEHMDKKKSKCKIVIRLHGILISYYKHCFS